MRRRYLNWVWWTLVPLAPIAGAQAAPAVIARGADAGGYAAFPDICRTRDGELLCVFYSGSGHVTTPSAGWPRCGRILAIRSRDEGKTWSKPVVIADTPDDDRDPSLSRLKDDTLLMNWFALVPAAAPARGPWSGVRLLLSRSADSGRTWGDPERIDVKSEYSFACSSPIRPLRDGSLLLPLYHEGEKGAFGATIKSHDGGRTWAGLAPIGEKSGIYLDAETDVVALKDGRLLAALRSSPKKYLYSAVSSDQGKTWSAPRSLGFSGHCPYFLRHSSGVILLGCRHTAPTSKIGNATAVHWTADDGKTWNGPVIVDTQGGAYPSMVELSDGEVYCVYYEEGEGSSIRGNRLRVTPKGVEVVPGAQARPPGRN